MGTSGLDDVDRHAVSSSSSSAGVVNTTDGNSTASSVSGTWYGVRLPSPLSVLLEYSGRLRSSSSTGYYESVIDNNEVAASELRPDRQTFSLDSSAATVCSGRSDRCSGEVAIRIGGAVEQNHDAGLGWVSSSSQNQSVDDDLMGNEGGMPVLNEDADGSNGITAGERTPLVSSSSSLAGSTSGQEDTGSGNGPESNLRDLSSHESYNFQQLAKWLEQVLPFSLLLLVVFIRQHLQGDISHSSPFVSLMLVLACKYLKRSNKIMNNIYFPTCY